MLTEFFRAGESPLAICDGVPERKWRVRHSRAGGRGSGRDANQRASPRHGHHETARFPCAASGKKTQNTIKLMIVARVILSQELYCHFLVSFFVPGSFGARHAGHEFARHSPVCPTDCFKMRR